MKTFKIKYLGAVLALIAAGCAEDTLVKLNPNASLDPTTSASSVLLLKDNATVDALTISWPEPEYGFSASPSYTIFMDLEGGDFSAAVAVGIGNDIGKTFTTEELNKLLLNLGLLPEVQSVVDVKVEAKLGTYEKLVSNVISFNATPYSAFLDLSSPWGVVGSGYNNWGAFPDAPFYTTKTDGVLVSYVTLVDGAIKFRQNNAWDVNVGDNGADGTLESGGADIVVTAGTYKIVFNTNDNTYTINQYYWGVVGDAYNDWGATPDFKFTYDDATDQWRAIIKLKDGKMKIRKNSDWGLNYGDTGVDGTLDEGGDDIAVTAGKYIITWSENDLSYSIEPIDNIWGLVGSAYNEWGATPDAQFDRDWRNDDVWVLKNVTLLDGAYKIRDDNAWTLNYGDTGADGTLDEGGTDIVSTAGVHTITLDFSVVPPTYSVVKY